jgi:hypothetical protein
MVFPELFEVHIGILGKIVDISQPPLNRIFTLACVVGL